MSGRPEGLLKRGIVLSLVVFGVWLLWSGHFEALLVGFGILSSLFVVSVLGRLSMLDREAVPTDILPKLVVYIPWLVLEIVKANLDVARRVLHPKMPIHPMIVRVRSGQRSAVGRVLYANSITLTPGTITVGVEGDDLIVHALSAEAAEGVETGDMERRVRAVDGRG